MDNNTQGKEDAPPGGEGVEIIDSSARGGNSGLNSWESQNKCSNVRREESDKLQEMHNSFENTAFQLTKLDVWEPGKNSLHSAMSDTTNSEEYMALNYTSPPFNAKRISVHRNPVDFSYIKKIYGMLPREKASRKVIAGLKSRCACNINCFISFIMSIFPILSWLPNYKLEFLMPDLISGFTVSVLLIPQGMAYGILASVNAKNGLYVSFFPVLVYFVLGTSRHISVGTFAVVSLMVSSSIANINAIPTREYNLTIANSTSSEMMYFPPTYLEAATSLAIGVGLWQLLMGVLQLGALAVVLSDQLVSGFSTGAACHVAASQLADLFGISVGRYGGSLKLVYTLTDLFQQLANSNVATVIISAIAIFILVFVKEQVNGRFRDKLKMPVPIDLVVVIITTVISHVADFHRSYGVAVIGYIPTGLPAPVLPRMDLAPMLLMDSFAIAIVAFAISLSLAKIFAKKHKYEIRPSQELIALGCANIFSSFFSCFPCSASLSRSLVQERAGGRTQVAGVFSCCILLLVLLVLAPMFYSLPKCILSCVILVALKGMFLQLKDFVKAWKVSKTDSFIWLVTFLTTVILDVTYGLLAGVVFSIITVIVRTILPSRSFLGNIKGTDLYLDTERYTAAKEVKGVKIFHFESAVYFINKELFKNLLLNQVPIYNSEICEKSPIKKAPNEIHHIIIDCSSFSYVDMSGLETLLEIMKEYKEEGITVFLAGCSVSMYDLMERTNFFDRMPKKPSLFPTIYDAVQLCSED